MKLTTMTQVTIDGVMQGATSTSRTTRIWLSPGPTRQCRLGRIHTQRPIIN